MLKPLLIVSLGLVAAAPIAYNASSAKKAERMKQFVTWRIDDAMDELNATDAQRGQVARVRDRVFADAAPLAESKERVKGELLAQLEAPRPDASRLHALVDERIDAARAFAHKVVDAAVELHGIFTAEQRAKIAAKIRARTGGH